ncbi:MAG TPA: hypothetical protein VMU83_05905 [Hanamia sp.]|nr:hypothetical protein [Hanamia sp.]
MNYRDYNEIDKWRTSATKYKKELNDLIREYLSLKNKDRTYEEDIQKLKKEIEEYKQALNKQKQPKTSLGEKMSLLHHFEIVDFVNKIKLEQKQKYKLLSYIVDAHEKNVAAYFNTSIKYKDSSLNNIPNNEFLVKIFHEFKMEEPEKQAQTRLDELQQKKR